MGDEPAKKLSKATWQAWKKIVTSRKFCKLLEFACQKPLQDYYSPCQDLIIKSKAKSSNDTTIETNNTIEVNNIPNFKNTKLQELEDWFKKTLLRNKNADVIEATKPGQYSERSLHSVKDLEEINLKVTSMSPQNDPGELLEQLELFERLHHLYEKKQIKKCLLSAYIYISRQYRMDILSYMGSPMADAWSREHRLLPIVWQRLAKIPGSISLLNDKGFAGTERYYQIE
jgi:hypothetical protein